MEINSKPVAEEQAETQLLQGLEVFAQHKGLQLGA